MSDKLKPEQKKEMWAILRTQKEKASTMNHYELARLSFYSPEDWRTFLTEMDVQEWREEELKVLRSAELAKLTSNIANSRSTGQAQILNALQKLNEGNSDKSGPMLVYCYVPLNDQQASAPNVVQLDKDIFETEQDNVDVIEPIKESDVFEN